MKGLYLILAGCLLAALCMGQQLPVLRYSTSQGLGHQVVYRVYQDKKGFIWFSTDNGITRYDGHEFKNFTAKDGLGSNFIFGATENDTTLLVSTFGSGLHYLTDGRFSPVPWQPPLLTHPINITFHDSALWVIDRNYDFYKITTRKTKKYERQLIDPTKSIFSIYYNGVFNTSSGLWIATSQVGTNLTRYQIESDSLETVSIKGLPYLKNTFSIAGITEHELLMAAGEGLYHIDLNQKTAKLVMRGDFDRSTECILRTHDNYFWIAETSGRVWRLSPELTHKELIFDNVVVNDLHQDRERNIWLATYGQGVWCIPATSIQRHSISGLVYPSVFYSQRLNIPLITSVNAGTLGLRKNGVFETRLLTKKNNNRITCLFEKDSTATIIGNLSSVIKKTSTEELGVFFLRTIASLYEDNKQTCWAGLRPGLVKIDSSFQKHQFIQEFNKRFVRCIGENGDGQLVAGTDNGLYINRNNGWLRLGKQEGLSNEYVNTLYYDKQRKLLWLGTNEGFFSVDDSLRISIHFPYIRCNVLVADKYNHLWAATSMGLLHFDGSTFELYGEKEGLSSDLSGIAYNGKEHALYVLSTENVYTIDINGFLESHQPNTPMVFVNEQWADTLRLSNTITNPALPSSTQALTINLGIPFYKNNANWSIYYRLNDQSWVNTGWNTNLTFYELPYGENTIEVKVQDDINNRSSEVLTLAYVVETPFFRKKTVVATIGVLLTVLGSVLSIVFIRYAYKKKQRAFIEEQRKAELEQKVLRNMLNPHFMNNALNAIQVFVTRNDQRKTLSYLSKFARLMRINLELLEKSLVTLEKELINIELYLEFEVLRSEGKLTYTLDVSPSVNQAKMKVPSLVLQPFVENAIWHGILPKASGGHVGIYINQVSRLLHIRIMDDGIGLDESKKRKNTSADSKPSRGLAIIQERFTLLNQQYRGHSFVIKNNADKDATAIGATVEITLPVRY
jgi:ligand-binding sensor domain-containing protein